MAFCLFIGITAQTSDLLLEKSLIHIQRFHL